MLPMLANGGDIAAAIPLGGKLAHGQAEQGKPMRHLKDTLKEYQATQPAEGMGSALQESLHGCKKLQKRENEKPSERNPTRQPETHEPPRPEHGIGNTGDQGVGNIEIVGNLEKDKRGGYLKWLRSQPTKKTIVLRGDTKRVRENLSSIFHSWQSYGAGRARMTKKDDIVWAETGGSQCKFTWSSCVSPMLASGLTLHA
ncbi:hypothetical protein ABW19_dt0209309 [Dactylella cylindrospora]|nr:hypothetical protein ABW19_dt0209309 [Dactylella cylindrospora]